MRELWPFLGSLPRAAGGLTGMHILCELVYWKEKCKRVIVPFFDGNHHNNVRDERKILFFYGYDQVEVWVLITCTKASVTYELVFK